MYRVGKQKNFETKISFTNRERLRFLPERVVCWPFVLPTYGFDGGNYSANGLIDGARVDIRLVTNLTLRAHIGVNR